MLKKLLATTLMAATASWAFAAGGSTASVEAVAGSPAGTFTADVSEVVNDATNWSVGLLQGTTSGGATFVYEPDPNGGNFATAPDRYASGARWVTFVSLPFGQSKNNRFNDTGEAGLAGAVITDPTSVRVNFFDAPPVTSGDGYISRVTIDLSGTGFDQSLVGVGTTVPGGATVLASMISQVGTTGDPAPAENQLDWFIYAIPEPASLALLALGGLVAFRRR